MGSMVGHVLPGLGFLLVGLWHLVNHIILYCLHPKSYSSRSWFPTWKFKYFELFFMMAGSFASISMELFVGPARHQPLDADGTIPTYHLHNFEHSNISLSIFTYALFAIILDRFQPPAQRGLTEFFGAVALGQELLLFHLHSTDHMGLEGHYHWLLQILISVSLISTLLVIAYPKSFLISFVRSLGLFFQGIWLNVLGVMIWTPAYVPKGCYLNFEEGHYVVRCHDHDSLERAKSLVNIEFSWYLVGVTSFAVCLYLALHKVFPAEEKVEYHSLFLTKFENQDEEQEDDVEAQKSNKIVQPLSFLPVVKPFAAADKEM